MPPHERGEFQVREVSLEDAAALLELSLALDAETQFMMLEPGERQVTLEQQSAQLELLIQSESRVMFVAERGSQLVGFVAGLGLTARRNRHVMSCVIGVRQSAAGRGLGAELMTQLETWARARDYTRIELTVMAHNERARRLYLGRGFEVEGTRRRALRVDGEYVDELYMAKVWG